MTINDVGGEFAEFTKEGVTVIDFWASWCGPCRMLAPVLDTVAEELSGVKFGKVDVDKYSDLAKSFNVSSIPNICVFKDGKLVDRVIGVQPAAVLQEMISKHID